MTVPEVIAYLDVLENRLETFKGEVRSLRHTLFEGLDPDSDSVVE